MIIASIMQISFFITPVMWRPEQLTERAESRLHLNPLASYLEILRQPLLGHTASLQAWLTACAMVCVLGIASVSAVPACAAAHRLLAVIENGYGRHHPA